MTIFEQAWRDAYGTPEAWERERHGTAEQAQSEVYGTPQSWQRRRRHRLARDLYDRRYPTGSAPAAPRPPAGDIFERELADTLEAERLKRHRP